MKLVKKLTFVTLVCTLIALYTAGCAINPDAPYLSLEGYELVFCDEFEGDSLDLDTWHARDTGERRGGYNHAGQARVENGNLIIKAEYRTSEMGEGWHSTIVETINQYTYGYFEVRCIPNDSQDFWSAFWLMPKNPYSHEISQGGVYGAEIDVFESYQGSGVTVRNHIASTIHCNGYDDNPDELDSLRVVDKLYVPNLCTKFNTFGLLWTQDEYVFYVNGRETARSSFGSGVSTVPERVLVSLEIPDEINLDKSASTEFIVDYVKIYQLVNS